MDNRKKFLRNRGGLLRKPNANNQNQNPPPLQNQTQTQTNPNGLQNPFSQPATANPFQHAPNTISGTSSSKHTAFNQNYTHNNTPHQNTPNTQPSIANQGVSNNNKLATAQPQIHNKQLTQQQANTGGTGPGNNLAPGHTNVVFRFTQEELLSLNASEEIVRFTTNKMPALHRAKDIQMPVGCHIRPFFNTGEEVPVINFFEMFKNRQMHEPDKKFDLPRCSECRAFVNPFFKFIGAGEQMQCNLCLKVQSVPAFYVSKLDKHGFRGDLLERYSYFFPERDFKSDDIAFARYQFDI